MEANMVPEGITFFALALGFFGVMVGLV